MASSEHPVHPTFYPLTRNRRVSEDVPGTYWGGDRSIPSPRPFYQINDTFPGTDVAAQTAAAFAACSNLYAQRAVDDSIFSTPASLRDDAFSDTLLTRSRQLY